ncbi:MAG: hypothetical protein HC909_01900 [Blastochloris sp.]|nr:hypothetical protein [Blastochloris sp.]
MRRADAPSLPTDRSRIASAAPHPRSPDTTPAAIDLAGFNAAAILIAVGAGGIAFDATNKIEFVLKHGDDSTVGNHTAVAQADVVDATVAPAASSTARC